MISFFMALISTLSAQAGGYLALSKRKNLDKTLGFTAGILIGLVAFDLLPEIFEGVNNTGIDIIWPMLALVGGFLLFHVVEKSILIHHSHEENYTAHHHPHVGFASAVALIGHSFLDGMSIGLAFQVNQAVGMAVAVAVIGHRFVDGFNGVNLMLINKNGIKQTQKVLWVVALAPIAGALLANWLNLPEKALVIYMGFFAGFMIYIGAADILPEAHRKKSSRGTIILTVLGALLMLVIARLVQA